MSAIDRFHVAVPFEHASASSASTACWIICRAPCWISSSSALTVSALLPFVSFVDFSWWWFRLLPGLPGCLRQAIFSAKLPPPSQILAASPYTTSDDNSEETRAMFKKGQLAYRENALGGCANPEPCDKPPFDWLDLECLENNCKNLIVVPSKLQRVIKIQERRVEALRASALGSVEYRMETAALATMLAAQEKNIKKSQS